MARLRALAATALLAGLAGLVACSSDDTTATAASSEVSALDTVTSTTLPALRDFAVGEHRVELVDASRPTMAHPRRGLPEEPNRTIPVLVLYPAAGEPAAGEPAAGSSISREAAPADGRFPLIVFSHGVTATADLYVGRLERWARKGYIVAAPTYPHTSGAGAEIHDYVNQPDDVSFVIDELRLRAEEPDHLLHGHLDGEHVAVAGHSLGAITTIGAAFNSAVRDPRVDAAVEISGIELPFPNGSYDNWPDVPLLAIHGEKDATVPFSGSETLVAKASPPTYLLRYPEAGHVDLLAGPSGDLLDEVLIAFLDRYLKDDGRRLAEAPAAVEASGLAGLEVEAVTAS